MWHVRIYCPSCPGPAEGVAFVFGDAEGIRFFFKYLSKSIINFNLMGKHIFHVRIYDAF